MSPCTCVAFCKARMQIRGSLSSAEAPYVTPYEGFRCGENPLGKVSAGAKDERTYFAQRILPTPKPLRRRERESEVF